MSENPQFTDRMSTSAEAERHRLTEDVLEFIEAGVDAEVPDFNDYCLRMFALHYRGEPDLPGVLRRQEGAARGYRPLAGCPHGLQRRLQDPPCGLLPAGAVGDGLPHRRHHQPDPAGPHLPRRGRQAAGLRRQQDDDRRLSLPRLRGGKALPHPDPRPESRMAPSMGMAIGMDQTRQAFGTPDSMFLLGKTGIDVNELLKALRESEASGVPVALIGATSAYVYFFQACRRKKMTFRLPPGSRICDGGGYRGRFGVVTRDDYYAMVQEILGIPNSHCVNVLGEAETATNLFDDSLRRHVKGLPPAQAHPAGAAVVARAGHEHRRSQAAARRRGRPSGALGPGQRADGPCGHHRQPRLHDRRRNRLRDGGPGQDRERQGLAPAGRERRSAPWATRRSSGCSRAM